MTRKRQKAKLLYHNDRKNSKTSQEKLKRELKTKAEINKIGKEVFKTKQ